MAQMKDNTGHRAKSLAGRWGLRFGNTDWSFTIGMMRNLLRGNPDKGLKAYRYQDVQGCIEWLYQAKKERKLKKEITGPGVIKWVIDSFLAGKDISETFLGYEKPTRKVKML